MRSKLFAALLTGLVFTAGCAPAAVEVDVFGGFDNDGDGFITEAEFNEDIADFDTDVTFGEIDADDGLISEDEFGA